MSDTTSTTILIVEDSATHRAALAAVLEHTHRLLHASNGAEGIGLARVERPDLVITDVLMPKVDGYQLLRDLRADPGHATTPVVVHTSAYDDDAVRDMVGSDPFAYVLRKPSDEQAILDTVRRALNGAPVSPRPTGPRAARDDASHLAALNELLIEKVRELQLADRERDRLLGRLVQAQEEERERIAADIHDDSIQVLTAAAMRLELLGQALTDPSAIERHAALRETMRLAIARLRHLLFQLRPPELDRDGLDTAIALQLEQSASDAGYAYELTNRMRRQPPIALRVLLYRIVQEALVNVAKHAQASAVDVLLDERDDGYLVRVVDDGVGLPRQDHGPLPGHLGLTSMRQRAELAGGRCRITGTPGEGTTVEAWVPHRESTADTVS